MVDFYSKPPLSSRMFGSESEADPFSSEESFASNVSASRLVSLFTTNLVWNLFLTSTAIHALALITSPMQAVYKWYRRRSSDSDTSLPYIFAIIGSSLWLRYSIFLGDTKLILLQTYAVSMQIFFLSALIFYRTKKRRLVRSVTFVCACCLAFFSYVAGLEEDEGRALTGRAASGAQMAGSFVCPYLIYKAVSSRVIDFVPLAPIALTWVMELHAIIYSIGIDDFYMLLANTTFFCMDGSLLAMFFIFPTERNQHKIEIA